MKGKWPYPYEVTDEQIAWLRALPRRPVEVPRALTPASLVDVRRALANAYAEMFCRGAACNDAVRVALAHLAMEHGLHAWTSRLEADLFDAGVRPPAPWLATSEGALAFVYVWSMNLGNRQVRAQDHEGGVLHAPSSVPWFRMTSPEVIAGKRTPLPAPYYAYPDLAESARGYWQAMAAHYPAALAAMEAGDVPGTARALKLEGWYTGDADAYAAGMVTSWGRVE